MAKVRPLYVPAPYQDAADSGRLILQDGTTAQIRIAKSEDLEKLLAFFQRLSPEARWRRFFSMGVPPRDFIRKLCDSSNLASDLTLIVTSIWHGEDNIIATGSYQALEPSGDQKTAEVAFAVDDAFHRKGLGTLLLERLAVLAARQGFVRFWAVTHADNRPMIEVFQNSGFAIKEKQESGTVEVELSVIPGEEFLAKSEMRDRVATSASMR